MDAARRLATYEDLLALPDEVRAEVLAGEVVVSPGALPEHGYVQSALTGDIGAAFGRGGGPGGWWILPEVDVRLSRHDVLRPDVSGWRRERLPSPWGVRPIDVAPDWVCEIESPSTGTTDRVRKARIYADAGVPHYWLVDPVARTLEALARQDDGSWRRTAYADGDKVRIAPFETLELDVGALFPPG